jgi:hypothetical protein
MPNATRGGLVLSLIPALAVLVVGCGSPTSGPARGDGKKDRDAGQDARRGNTDRDGPAVKNDKGTEARHEGWWCEEHGIPEEECSRCSKKVADAFKAKGDWCDKHNRARSQCFLCDPKLQEQFAARYRAMSKGKEPPPITDP